VTELVNILDPIKKITYTFNGIIGYLNYVINADQAKQITHPIFSVYLPPDGSAGSVMFGGYSTAGFKTPADMQIFKSNGKMTFDTSLVKV
jgi:hypothetical protein